MNIGIDARIIYRRGVGRYISNLVKNLLKKDKKNHYFIYLDKKSALMDYIHAKNCHFRRLNTKSGFIFEQLMLPSAAKKDRLDVLHGTDNTMPYMKPRFKGKKVVTIHDTMFTRPLEKTISKPTIKQRFIDIYNKILVPVSAKAADKIITVSDYSKQDIIDDMGINEDKIEVIKEGVDPKYKIVKNSKRIESVKKKYGLDKAYIMISAAADKRKNTLRALEAFNIFNNLADYKYQLVMTSIGKREMATTRIMDKIKEFNLEKYVVITDYVPDDEMVLLYNGAFFLFFPSFWEGFGLQVLEAFACGLPVITSNNTSLKEVAGEGAYFINPFSVEDMVKGMSEVAGSAAKRNALIRKGKKQLEYYSWKDAAMKTLNVYREVVYGGG